MRPLVRRAKSPARWVVERLDTCSHSEIPPRLCYSKHIPLLPASNHFGTHPMHYRVAALLVLLLVLAGQLRDSTHAEGPQEAVVDAPLPASEAARSMVVPEGFQVTLFAGEPDVMQPIAFC